MKLQRTLLKDSGKGKVQIKHSPSETTTDVPY